MEGEYIFSLDENSLDCINETLDFTGSYPIQPTTTIATTSSTTLGPPKPSRKEKYNIALKSKPAQELSLPSDMNITLYELIAFLPNHIKHLHFATRMCNNGIQAHLISSLANYIHNLTPEQGRVLANSITAKIRKPMRGKYGKEWIRSSHQVPADWHSSSSSSSFSSAASLSVGEWRFGLAVPFEQLAVGVVRFPDGDDALDLARCVAHAVAYPGIYSFPDDYDIVLREVGGRVGVQRGHGDGAARERWDGYFKEFPFWKA